LLLLRAAICTLSRAKGSKQGERKKSELLTTYNFVYAIFNNSVDASTGNETDIRSNSLWLTNEILGAMVRGCS